MPIKKRVPLLWKMFLVYICILLLGTLLLTAKNLWVHDLSFEQLAQFFFGAITFFNLIFLLLMQTITYIRIRAVNRYFRGQAGSMNADQVLRRLHRFPAELFWSMILLSIMLSIVYHVTAIVFTGEAESMMQLLGSFFSEQALAVTLAVMVYSLLRITLRPYVQSLKRLEIGDWNKTTLARPLLLSFISCFVIISFDVLRIIFSVADEGNTVDIVSLISIVTVDFLLSLSVFSLLIWELWRELRFMIKGIASLASGKRAELHGQIFIGFPDEIGQLAEAFNAEQQRIASRYDRLDEELQLAYAVQEILLPAGECRFGSLHVRAVRRSREVMGEWFDIISIEAEAGRFAVVTGSVSGQGMPAALVMSAALFLLRSEIRRGSSAGEALGRLRGQLYGTLPADVQINIGLAMFDANRGTVQFTAAGPVFFGVWRVTEGWSEPLIREQSVVLQKGDCVVMAVDEHASEVQARNILPAFGLEDRTMVIVSYDPPEGQRCLQGDESIKIGSLFTGKWRINSAYGQEKIVTADAARIVADYFALPERVEEVVTAVGEACLNALEHGNKLNPDYFVEVRMEVTEEACIFRIYDEGGGFDYVETLANRGEMQRQPNDTRGWGLLFISTFADYVCVGKESNKFYVELTFHKHK